MRMASPAFAGGLLSAGGYLSRLAVGGRCPILSCTSMSLALQRPPSSIGASAMLCSHRGSTSFLHTRCAARNRDHGQQRLVCPNVMANALGQPSSCIQGLPQASRQLMMSRVSKAKVRSPRFRLWRDSDGVGHEEKLGPTEAHEYMCSDRRSVLLEQVRSIWMVRNGSAGASLALGGCIALLGHGNWPAFLLLSPRIVELVIGPFISTSWTLVFLHGIRRVEDEVMNFSAEERRERAFSSRGPLGFALVALMSGLGFAISATIMYLLERKRLAESRRHPSPSLLSFVSLF